MDEPSQYCVWQMKMEEVAANETTTYSTTPEPMMRLSKTAGSEFVSDHVFQTFKKPSARAKGSNRSNFKTFKFSYTLPRRDRTI
jgi:hypothetical protein